jgi:hypothetical protein
MCSSEYLAPPTGIEDRFKNKDNQICLYLHNATVQRFLGASALS